ncbi:MAG: hypothetical protein JST19_00305 [Bacteroidetes bacterium]|nr:hypothetical protein [Bacteroidota bacterium]
MVEVFKTNVRGKRQARALLNILSDRFPLLRINFDLDDCDKILRVEGDAICQESITELVAENGYACDVLE